MFCESSFCDICHEYGCVCDYERAADILADELGRDPTDSEVSARVAEWDAAAEARAEARARETREDREWRQELANEAGMLGGCQAYNDAMGY